MKIRNGFVSNSSSSSFIVADDIKIFDTQGKFFNRTYMLLEVLEEWCINEELIWFLSVPVEKHIFIEDEDFSAAFSESSKGFIPKGAKKEYKQLVEAAKKVGYFNNFSTPGIVHSDWDIYSEVRKKYIEKCYNILISEWKDYVFYEFSANRNDQEEVEELEEMLEVNSCTFYRSFCD